MDNDIEHRLTGLETWRDAANAQIDAITKRQDDLDELVAAVATVKTEQGYIKNDLSEIKNDVKALAEKPGKRWDSLVDKLLLLLAGAFLGWLVSGGPGL